jgi:hypothetical protein
MFDVLCFPVGNVKQDTVFAAADDAFLNTSQIYRLLPPSLVLRMWTNEDELNLDILQLSMGVVRCHCDKISEASSVFYFQIHQKIFSVPSSLF